MKKEKHLAIYVVLLIFSSLILTSCVKDSGTTSSMSSEESNTTSLMSSEESNTTSSMSSEESNTTSSVSSEELNTSQNGEEEKNDEFIFKLVNNNEYSICGLLDNQLTDAIIPSEFKDLQISVIGEGLFDGCFDLKNVVIPKTIKFIEKDAFSCISIENVYYDGTIEDWLNINFDGYNAAPMRYAKNLYFLDDDGSVEYNTKKYSLLKEVTTPKGITKINSFAFYGCNHIETLQISEGIVEIMNDAFSSCKSLTDIILPESLKIIGDLAFANCSSLKSVNIPRNVTTIRSYAFSNCKELESIFLPNSLIECHYTVFEFSSNVALYCEFEMDKFGLDNGYITIYFNCKGIGEEIIYEGVEYHIEDKRAILIKCPISEESITIPENIIIDGKTYVVEEISKYAFSNLIGVKSINIPNTIKKIDQYAFYALLNLESFTMPDSLISIGENAFAHNYNLSNVFLNEGLEVIGANAFEDCESLTNVNIPSTVKNIRSNAFSDCSSLTNVTISDNSSLLYIDSGAFYNTKLESFIIPESVTSIGSRAFGKTNIKEIRIPKNVNNLMGDLVSECNLLESISVDEENVYYDSRNNCNAIIETELNCLITTCKNTIIPTGVETLGSSSFSNAQLDTLIIPEGVREIYNYAFMYSTISEIVIPSSITYIYSTAFSFCQNLEKIFYFGTKEEWNRISVDEYGNEDLLSANIYFYCEETPTDSGNYWKYVDGVPTIINV